MIFETPYYLSGLILIPVIIGWMIYNHSRNFRRGVVQYSNTTLFAGLKPTARARLAPVMPWLAVIALTLMLIALARPKMPIKESLIRREGVDIILALDISTSMLAEDFFRDGRQISRLEAVKAVARDFILNRPNDRTGIVVFAGSPYILAPLSWEHDWQVSRLAEVTPQMISDSGMTALGSALAAAVNRLRDSKAKSKVILFLTDGMNNAGQIMPETAIKSAKDLGVIIYSIGAGSKGVAQVPDLDSQGQVVGYHTEATGIDEGLLTQMANSTGGRYFRATDAQTLSGIFERINRMAKTSNEAPVYGEYRELYPWLLLGALLLLFMETTLSNTVFRRFQ
ncbi:MAG: VWA domain-containing protein [Firmicutes bacterium]|nr:VWA domain-containing protein [Bacillota bacterium]